jgi:hypothetical protein
LPFLATGCLDFESQTVFIVFSGKKDAHALLVYEGLNVHNASKDSVKNAKTDLDNLVAGKVLYLGNAFARFPITEEAGKPDEEGKQFLALVNKHLTIDKGAFYTDHAGKLAYYHTITVRDAPGLVAGLNDFICQGVDKKTTAQLEKREERPDNWDEESTRILQKAARSGYRWLQVEPGRVSLSLPRTPALVKGMKKELDSFTAALKGVVTVASEVEAADPLDPDKTRQRMSEMRRMVENQLRTAQLLADLPWSFEQRRDRCILSLGLGDGEPLRLNLQANTRPTSPPGSAEELLRHARTLGVPFRKEVMVDGLIEDFRRKHTAVGERPSR